MEAIYFRRQNGALVKLSENAVATMRSLAQLSGTAPEAGGVLIGRHIATSEHVVVDSVTIPMRGDRQSRLSFHRSKKPHQRVLDREWRESDRTSVYLGEWHTHPEPLPLPSGVDMDDWRRRLKHDSVDAPFLVFLIVGQNEIRAWEGSRYSFGVSRLPSHRLAEQPGASG